MFEHMFRCGALDYDKERHEVFYGARLIYSEVMDGFGGVVYDRQTARGEPETVDQHIFPKVPDFMDLVRSQFQPWDSGSSDVLQADFGDGVVFAASPQGSYGYLYLSAVVLR